MDGNDAQVDDNASSQLALTANILTILVALLQLTTLLAEFPQRLHLLQGEIIMTRYAWHRD